MTQRMKTQRLSINYSKNKLIKKKRNSKKKRMEQERKSLTPIKASALQNCTKSLKKAEPTTKNKIAFS